MRHLNWVSPHLTGKDVEQLQRALGDGLEPDGDYGKNTAAAVRRHKSLLGFAKEDLETGASVFFQEILFGKRDVPDEYVKTAALRAAGRKAAEAKRPKADVARAAALEWALSHVGMSEEGDRNRGPLLDRWQIDNGHGRYSSRTEAGWPWCGVYVWAAYYYGADVTLDRRLRSVRWAYEAAAQGLGPLSVVDYDQARAGDLVVLFSPDTHIGMVRAKPTSAGLPTVEGNTGGSRPWDGGMVDKPTRNRSDCKRIIRVTVG